MKRTVSAAFVLTLALALLLPALLHAGGAQAAANTVAKAPVPKTDSQTVSKVKAPPVPQTVHPGYASLREKTAVLVFLAWLWLIVGIFAYLLRLKIREADRVYGLKLYPAVKDAPRPPTQ